MSMLLAAAAFLMALGALWFTSEVARRTEGRGRQLVKPHLAPLQADLRDARKELREIARDLENANREIKVLRLALGQMRDYDRISASPEPEAMDAPLARDLAPRDERGRERFRPSGLYDA